MRKYCCWVERRRRRGRGPSSLWSDLICFAFGTMKGGDQSSVWSIDLLNDRLFDGNKEGEGGGEGEKAELLANMMIRKKFEFISMNVWLKTEDERGSNTEQRSEWNWLKSISFLQQRILPLSRLCLVPCVLWIVSCVGKHNWFICNFSCIWLLETWDKLRRAHWEVCGAVMVDTSAIVGA